MPKRRVLCVSLLVLALALIVLPGAGLARNDNGNDNKKKDDKPESSRQTNDKPAAPKPASSPQTITPADARPDLDLTFGGFNSPGNVQLIKFTVKNLGTAPSSANTKVRVVTSTPEPTPWFRELDLPSLKPGESTEVFYPLAADCNGHFVKALVNDAADPNGNNNLVEIEVCPPPIVVVNSPPPPPPPAQPVTRALAPVASRTLTLLKEEGDCYSDDHIGDEGRNPPFPLMAGFRNHALERFAGDCQANGIWQAAVRFDLAEIRREWAAGRVSVLTMELTFTETPYLMYDNGTERTFSWSYWRPPGPDGPLQMVSTPTCWPRLARPTADWGGTTRVVPNEVLVDAGKIGSFALTDRIGDMLRFPENDGLGFLILGHNEEMHFNDAECLSKIDDVRLTVTYIAR